MTDESKQTEVTQVTQVTQVPTELRDLHSPAKEQPAELNPHEAAPPSLPAEEPRQPAPIEGTGPSHDHDLQDSLGNPKTLQNDEGEHEPIEEAQPLGPRGADVPPEHLTEAAKSESAAAEQQRLQQGMSSTDGVDSAGNPKGEFRTTPQGNDAHGARLPDVIHHDEGPLEPPPMIGPRGQSAPPESFNGPKK